MDKDLKALTDSVESLKEYLMKKEIENITKADVDDALGVGNEAKSSVSYSLSSKNGFPFIFTVRENDEAVLLDLMDTLESSFVKRGFQAERKSGGYPAKVKEFTGEKCPKCQAELVKFASKDGTKTGSKCSTSKYDYMTKTASGCDYVKWDENASGGTLGASEAQKAILTDKGLWKDGMSREEATKTITEFLSK